MRQIALLTGLLLTGCVQSHYEFDRERANARLKARVIPAERSKTWKTHDQVVDLFPKSLNLPHYRDLVGRVLQPPRVLDAGRPVYPADLIEAHMEGHVLVVVVISTQGTVIDARVLQTTNRLLNDSAVACARRWKFSPATIDGKPTNFVFALPIDFSVGHH